MSSIAIRDLPASQADFAEHVKNFVDDSTDEEFAKLKAAQQIPLLRWDPINTPVYIILGVCMLLFTEEREKHLAISRWLSTVANVPVDGTDASGTTALEHFISTYLAYEPEFSQILYDAGAEINHRNRHGDVAAHSIGKVMDSSIEDL